MEAASQCYFGKSVDKLTPSQAAYLAGIINGPELYDSTARSAKAAARARWTYVLDGMARRGAITPGSAPRRELPKVLSQQPASQTKPAVGDQTEYLMGMVPGGGQGLRHQRADLQRSGYRI